MRAWRTSIQSGVTAPFKVASRTAKAALRQYRRCEELRLIYSNNRKVFFSHVHSKTASHYGHSIHLCDEDNALSDQVAADALFCTFSYIFSSTVPSPPRRDEHTPPAISLSYLNCTPSMVAEALLQCLNSSSSPGSLSFEFLKAISYLIICPLNTIFQHFLFEGIFLTI